MKQEVRDKGNALWVDLGNFGKLDLVYLRVSGTGARVGPRSDLGILEIIGQDDVELEEIVLE